jgi:hypothetical protein
MRLYAIATHDVRVEDHDERTGHAARMRIRLSLADYAQFLGCHFSPGRAKNDIQSGQSTMLPQAKGL